MRRGNKWILLLWTISSEAYSQVSLDLLYLQYWSCLVPTCLGDQTPEVWLWKSCRWHAPYCAVNFFACFQNYHCRCYIFSFYVLLLVQQTSLVKENTEFLIGKSRLFGRKVMGSQPSDVLSLFVASYLIGSFTKISAWCLSSCELVLTIGYEKVVWCTQTMSWTKMLLKVKVIMVVYTLGMAVHISCSCTMNSDRCKEISASYYQ